MFGRRSPALAVIAVIAMLASGCTGDATAQPGGDSGEATATSVEVPTATVGPIVPTSTPVPAPEITVADVEQAALASYVAAARDAGDEVQPVIAESSLQRVVVDDCVWVADQVHNVERTTTIILSVADTITVESSSSRDTGECLNDAMYASLKTFLEISIAHTASLYASAPTADLSDPRIDEYNDPLAADGLRTLVMNFADQNATFRGSGQSVNDEFAAWRYMDSEEGVAVIYCAVMDSSYGMYNDAGERIGFGPDTGTGDSAFTYIELVPADTELGWQTSGNNGLDWSERCTAEEWLEVAESWQTLDFELLP